MSQKNTTKVVERKRAAIELTWGGTGDQPSLVPSKKKKKDVSCRGGSCRKKNTSKVVEELRMTNWKAKMPPLRPPIAIATVN